jgi:hypothetical protein
MCLISFLTILTTIKTWVTIDFIIFRWRVANEAHEQRHQQPGDEHQNNEYHRQRDAEVDPIFHPQAEKFYPVKPRSAYPDW